MLGAEPLGDQHLDGLAQERGPVVAEEALRLGVDERDAPVPARDDEGIGRRLDERLEKGGRRLLTVGCGVGARGDTCLEECYPRKPDPVGMSLLAMFGPVRGALCRRALLGECRRYAKQ
jgi:hypothetical protein